MKIGIFTHPLDYNYGCLLQAYALQITLKKLGHEVVTLNRFTDTSKPFSKHFYDWAYRIYSKYVRGRKVSVLWNPFLSAKEFEILCKKTSLFVNRNISNTGIVYDRDLPLVDAKYLFDAYVVGSDQVWLPHFCPSSFLDFVNRSGVKKEFYAASAGKQSFANSAEKTARCRELVKSFSGVSVRETRLIQIAKDYLGVDAVLVLDPTLLLDASDYLNACIETTSDEPVLFTYILDKTDDKKKIVETVNKELHLNVVSGTVEQDYKKGCGMRIEDYVYPSVDHWILNLNRSNYVVTDSFHGTCMSIIFRKPFVVIGNVERGLERIKSLLQLFGLENRLVANSDDLKAFDFSRQIDYDKVYQILQEQREK